MSLNFDLLIFLIGVYPDLACAGVGSCKYRVLGIGVNGNQALGIRTSLNGVDKAQVIEIIDVGPAVKYYHHSEVSLTYLSLVSFTALT
jgi:hypothetical protein